MVEWACVVGVKVTMHTVLAYNMHTYICFYILCICIYFLILHLLYIYISDHRREALRFDAKM